MNRVLEIGCGIDPTGRRPFIGDANYFISDVRQSSIKEAFEATGHPAVCADARMQLPFASATFDTVIARDVFGDPTLGYSFEEAMGFSADNDEEFAQKLEERFKTETIIDALLDAERMLKIEKESSTSKLMIAVEVSRILKPAGRLVLIETRTPDVAEKFITKKSLMEGHGKHKRRVIRATSKSTFTVSSVANYAKLKKYCNEEDLATQRARVWLLQKD